MAHKITIFIIAVAVSAQMGFAATTQPAAKPASGKVLKVVGHVQYKKTTEKSWHKMSVGDVISSGMEIRSGLRSSAVIKVQDNSIVQIRSATRIAFSELAKEANVEKTRIFISYGTIRAGIVSEKVRSDFQIACPTAVLSREGTWGIEMSYDPATGRYRIGLDTDGLVRVVQTLTGKKIRIYPGQFVTNAMQMWVSTANFRRMVALTDPFGVTKIEKAYYVQNSGGLTGADPTGSRFTQNGIKQGITLHTVNTLRVNRNIAVAQRTAFNRVTLQRLGLFHPFHPRPGRTRTYNYRFGNFGTHISESQAISPINRWLNVKK